MLHRILLVEDDLQIGEVIRDYFLAKGKDRYELIWATDGNKAEELLYETPFDIALLDVMIPGMDGFALCREIRSNSDIPIIFLTARGSEEDILYGYDLGCDDYMVKPFRVAELFAKVSAMLNRAKGTVKSDELVCGNIRMNPSNYAVFVAGEQLTLAPKEYALLKYLLEHQGKIVTREQLLLRLWGYDFEGNDRVVDNHIKKLRAALGASGSYVKTKPRRGYMIEGKEQ